MRPPHPTLTLLLTILTVISLQIFVPDKYNYLDWVGIVWLIFWWLWMFPFLFVKIYDVVTVRRLRHGGGGPSSPLLRILGISILAIFLGIMLLIFVFWLIGQIALVHIR